MNFIKLSILFLLIELPTYATTIYFSQARMDHFACEIAHSIHEAYPNKTLGDFRSEILEILRKDIDPWVDAYPIPAGISLPTLFEKLTGLPGFPMDRSEYYLQNAFILYGNPKKELKEPTENYFASFIHLARTRHIAYLNGEAKKFQLRKEPDLIHQVEDHLNYVANNSFPYLDTEGRPIEQKYLGANDSDRYTLVIGNPHHKKFAQFVRESQSYNQFSSPLFIWLLQQENFSVTPEKLFEKALEIYDDPIVAIGVIPWIFSGDALTVDRSTSSVVSYKIEKIVEGADVPGFQYHFWGYLTQGIIGNTARVKALAYLYEKVYQRDIPDWTIDALSLKFADQIRAALKNPERCSSQH